MKDTFGWAAIGPVAALSADQAEAIMLRVVVGLDVARVAAITGKRPGAVRVFTHRGLRRLTERLGADFLSEGRSQAQGTLIQQ